MKRKKHIFFVTTVGSIYEQALPLIEEKKDSGDIIVVATTEQIELFFKHYTDFKVIRIQVHPDLINKKIWYKLFSNIIRSKLEYRKLFKEFKGEEVYFFGSAWAIVAYSYIQKLAKNNEIYQYLCRVSGLQHAVESNLKAILMKLFAKIFFNLDTIIVNDSVISSYVLDKQFYHKNNVHIISDFRADYTTLDKYMVKLDMIKNKKIFLPIGDLVTCEHINEAEFTAKMDDVVNILNESCPDSYAVKPHPRMNKLYGKIAESTVIPSYIPAEFVMKHPWELAVGIESNSLISLSKHTNAKVISLIDLFTYRNSETQKKFKTWLQTETQNEIFFPKDLHEFKQMIKIK